MAGVEQHLGMLSTQMHVLLTCNILVGNTKGLPKLTPAALETGNWTPVFAQDVERGVKKFLLSALRPKSRKTLTVAENNDVVHAAEDLDDALQRGDEEAAAKAALRMAYVLAAPGDRTAVRCLQLASDEADVASVVQAALEACLPDGPAADHRTIRAAAGHMSRALGNYRMLPAASASVSDIVHVGCAWGGA